MIDLYPLWWVILCAIFTGFRNNERSRKPLLLGECDDIFRRDWHARAQNKKNVLQRGQAAFHRRGINMKQDIFLSWRWNSFLILAMEIRTPGSPAFGLQVLNQSFPLFPGLWAAWCFVSKLVWIGHEILPPWEGSSSNHSQIPHLQVLHICALSTSNHKEFAVVVLSHWLPWLWSLQTWTEQVNSRFRVCSWHITCHEVS